MSWVAKDAKGRKYRAGRLRRHKWQRFLRGPDPELLDKLYVPALTEGVRYDRCCSYFSSSVLAAAARGFSALTERLQRLGADAPKPAVRLLVNEELSSADVTALQESGDVSALEAALIKRFKTPHDAFVKARLEMLAWLFRAGYLDIRVGLMRQGEGIVHPKFGIVTDEQDDSIVFRGSGNESASGLAANLEAFEVSGSWADAEGFAYHRAWFDNLWAGNDPYVHTVSLPEAVAKKLVKLAPEEPVRVEPSSDIDRMRAAMLWRYIAASPYLADGGATCDATMLVGLWPHQLRVIADTTSAWPAGRLLCDEVGMGKTLEAIGVIRRLRAGRGVKRVLILVPAGLLKQWQDELREKGGLVVPRYDNDHLLWPDETDQAAELAEALKQDILLMSRETARMERQLRVLLDAPDWDLLVMDEAHAARRAEAKEGEFNSANLLLGMLRELQLRGKAKGILLLSATPMQINPWEPWDLLTVLGVGGLWASEFRWVRTYYECLRNLKLARPVDRQSAEKVGALLDDLPGDDRAALPDAHRLPFAATSGQRRELADALRRCSPLVRHMHRNSRETLREYNRLGLLDREPPRRIVDDLPFDYKVAAESHLYQAVSHYIETRFGLLEHERPGKGFVMTIYRRRAASSPYSLHESLRRRREGLVRIQRRQAFDEYLSASEDVDPIDAEELGDLAGGRVPAGYPSSPQEVAKEIAEIDRLLAALDELGNQDSKRDEFCAVLRGLLDEGRKVLVFSSYTDTVDYVREFLKDSYGERVGSYTGRGGDFWNGERWVRCSKEEITKSLQTGGLQVLVCNDAASEGLNLQAASAIVNYDLPWNPSRVEQRIGRIDRIGQTRDTVRVVNLLLRDSVDERVYGLLRSRCGLFEHFVGPMQPVLAIARDVLLGRQQHTLSDIDSQARTVEEDVFAQELYRPGTATDARSPAPVSGADIDAAVDMLTGSMPVVAHRSGTVVVLDAKQAHGLGRRTKVSRDPSALAKDGSIAPLVPDSELCQAIAGALARESELLPLVIGTQTSDAGCHRRAVALWLDGDEEVAIRDCHDLLTRLADWSGQRPAPSRHREAMRRACAQTEAALDQDSKVAMTVRSTERAAQGAAAGLRLVQELGRFLGSLKGDAAELNSTFHRLMSGDDATSRRLRRAFELLGSEYPDWPPVIQDDLHQFCQGLTDGQRTALRAGSELDAAMDDPRWLAASTSASMLPNDVLDG